MEYMITGTFIGLCLFILPLWCYRRGLKDGLALNQGKTIEPIKTPLKIIAQAAEVKKSKIEQDKLSEDITNLFGYDGTDQKKGVKYAEG